MSCSADGGCDSSAGCCTEIVVSGFSAAIENKGNVSTWYSRGKKNSLKVPEKMRLKGIFGLEGETTVDYRKLHNERYL